MKNPDGERRGLKVSTETWNLIEDAKTEFRRSLKKKPTVDQLLNALLREHLKRSNIHPADPPTETLWHVTAHGSIREYLR